MYTPAQLQLNAPPNSNPISRVGTNNIEFPSPAIAFPQNHSLFRMLHVSYAGAAAGSYCFSVRSCLDHAHPTVGFHDS